MPVDFVMASYLTAFLPGSIDKAWGDLCGPPSSGKTEILRALEDGQQRTIMVDTLTENAFSSAMKDPDDPDKDFSLLYQLSTGRKPIGPKVLVIKEFSTILNMRREKSDKLFADLRSAYDGSFVTAAGNTGLETRNDVQFGLVTACTEKLDDHRKTNQTLGERTLVCRIGRELSTYEGRAKAIEFAKRMSPARKEQLQAKIRIQTRKSIAAAIKLTKTHPDGATMTEEHILHIGKISALATSIRTAPLSKTSYTTLAEAPFRFNGQLKAWGHARVLFDGRTAWNDSDYTMLRRIAQDSMPPDYIRAIKIMYEEPGLTEDEVRRKTMVDGDFYRQLKQWQIVDVLGVRNDAHYLSPVFRKDIEITGFLEGLV